MTKAFLLGFIVGANKGMGKWDNPYDWFLDREEALEWVRGYDDAKDSPKKNPMQDIMNLGE